MRLSFGIAVFPDLRRPARYHNHACSTKRFCAFHRHSGRATAWLNPPSHAALCHSLVTRPPPAALFCWLDHADTLRPVSGRSCLGPRKRRWARPKSKGALMARHVFKFVVSDVELTPDQLDSVSQAIGQAGSSALADLTPDDALTVEGRPGWWWRGRPPVE